MLLGMALLLAELVLPTDFFLFFFGVAALLVGIVVGRPRRPGLASVDALRRLAIASLVVLRRPRASVSPGARLLGPGSPDRRGGSSRR
jgi:membrane protein implicated in regulation of membrane protease activity